MPKLPGSDLPPWVRLLLVGRFVTALGSMAWLFVPLYLTQARQLDNGAAGLVAAAYGVGIIAGNLAGGSVGDRFGLRPTLAVANLGAAIGCVLVPVVPVDGLAVLLALRAPSAG